MFDRELDYYGIMLAEGITDQESIPKIIASFTDTFEKAQRKFNRAKMSHALFFLAHECHNKLYQTNFNNQMQNKPTTDRVCMEIKYDHMFY